jgi:hypothetical protein
MSRNEEFAGGSNGHKYTYQWGYQHPINGGSVTAHAEDGSEVGRLRIDRRDGPIINGAQYHKIHVNVREEHQRRGVATGMVRFAQTVFPHLSHSDIRTDDADDWAKSLDLLTPPRIDVSEINKWRLGPGEPV